MLKSLNLDRLTNDLQRDLVAFLPELLLCVGIVLLLLFRLGKRSYRTHLSPLALFFTLVAFAASVGQWMTSGGISAGVFDAPGSVSQNFAGLLTYDHLTVFLRVLLLGFTALVIWLSMLTGIPDREDSADFYTLLLGGTLGMMLMASSNHLLMVFIAVEMASLPSYALAGFLKGRRQSSEAALKYVVYGGGASGVMLYGMSLIAGRFGTGYMPDLVMAFQAQMAGGGVAALDTVVILGMVLILAGLGFKLSAVPFHFWCPDVFEGAAAEVGAFLSVASKAAAMALTGRVLMVLAGLPDGPHVAQVARAFGPAIAIFAAVTATFGNLAAYAQTNLKRLLAYSTIAHAGYMLMGLAPLNAEGVSAVLFYLVAYVFMNLGAFAIVAFLRNQTGSEDLSSFRGLVYRSPVMVTLLAVFLLSLLGLPPLVGFAAKFQIFQVLYDAGKYHVRGPMPVTGYTMYALLLIGGLNTVFSTFYYVKVLKVMILDKPLEEMENRPAEPLKLPVGSLVFGVLMSVMVFIGGIFWNPLALASDKGTMEFRPPEPPAGNGAPAGLSAPPAIPPPPPGEELPRGVQPKDKRKGKTK